jgi:ferredoxin
MAPEKFQWKHLYEEVVTTGLCTGCAGCVIACPHDVLGYRDDQGVYKPFHLEEGYAPDARKVRPAAVVREESCAPLPGSAGSVWNPAPLDLAQQRSGRQRTTEQFLHQ